MGPGFQKLLQPDGLVLEVDPLDVGAGREPRRFGATISKPSASVF